jgi:hypothetical protein
MRDRQAARNAGQVRQGNRRCALGAQVQVPMHHRDVRVRPRGMGLLKPQPPMSGCLVNRAKGGIPRPSLVTLESI